MRSKKDDSKGDERMLLVFFKEIDEFTGGIKNTIWKL